MLNNNKRVAIILGSDSDLHVADKACEVLKKIGVPFEINIIGVLSETPETARVFALYARANNFQGHHSYCR